MLLLKSNPSRHRTAAETRDRYHRDIRLQARDQLFRRVRQDMLEGEKRRWEEEMRMDEEPEVVPEP